ncbi:MAG: 50S ribosomal protein L6 [Gammaproteobacteria bacterium]
MSRIAKYPVHIPEGVQVHLDDGSISVQGSKGALRHPLHRGVRVNQEDGKVLTFAPREGVPNADALAGTTRALVQNMVRGVSQGFDRKLELVGVGYRAQVKGDILHLALGYSHPVEFQPPPGVTIEAPTQTEIIVKGIDKQQVGQVAATIRGFRAPEPYKGKGIRLAAETIVRKVAKKK